MSSRDCSRVVISGFLCFILCSFETLLKTSLCICSIWDFWLRLLSHQETYFHELFSVHPMFYESRMVYSFYNSQISEFYFYLLYFFFVLSNHFCTLSIFFKFARCPPGVCTGAKSFHNLCKRYLSAGSIKRIFFPQIVLVCSWGNLKELLISDKLIKQCIWPTSDRLRTLIFASMFSIFILQKEILYFSQHCPKLSSEVHFTQSPSITSKMIYIWVH